MIHAPALGRIVWIPGSGENVIYELNTELACIMQQSGQSRNMFDSNFIPNPLCNLPDTMGMFFNRLNSAVTLSNMGNGLQ